MPSSVSSAITAIGSYLTYPAFQVLQLSIRLLFESNLSLVSTIYWRRLTFLTALPQHRTVTCNARRPLRRVRSGGQSFFLRRDGKWRVAGRPRTNRAGPRTNAAGKTQTVWMTTKAQPVFQGRIASQGTKFTFYRVSLLPRSFR